MAAFVVTPVMFQINVGSNLEDLMPHFKGLAKIVVQAILSMAYIQFSSTFLYQERQYFIFLCHFRSESQRFHRDQSFLIEINTDHRQNFRFLSFFVVDFGRHFHRGCDRTRRSTTTLINNSCRSEGSDLRGAQ